MRVGLTSLAVIHHIERILLCILRIIFTASDFTRIADMHSSSIALDVLLSASHEAQALGSRYKVIER